MKRILICIIWCLTAHANAAISVVDDDGNTVVLSHPAQRIITLAPHLTEMMFAVGAGPRIVGTVTYSDFPAEAKRIPLIGDNLHIDLERVAALKPDLLVVWQHGNASRELDALRQLGIPLFYSEPHDLAQIPDTLTRLGRLAGTDAKAQQVADSMRTQLNNLAARYAHRPNVRVFYQVWDKPLYTLNGKHYVSDVIRLCGGENIFAGLTTTAPVVGVEAVLQENPEAIMTGDLRKEENGLALWKAYPRMLAVQRGNLFAFDPDLLVRPGPRIVDGAAAVCEKLDLARSRREPRK
ncbi:MAG: cobalamin-binding protein [Burkholderiaceae bacterium]|nr:cobalamin-binding protein [Burkholderiaceae bacterium]